MSGKSALQTCVWNAANDRKPHNVQKFKDYVPAKALTMRAQAETCCIVARFHPNLFFSTYTLNQAQ